MIMSLMYLSEFNIKTFIESVKKRPCLWNTSHVEYHDKTKKRNAWQEVCCIMFPDFKEKPEKEQYVLESKMIKKWKNFRDAYFRHLRKNTFTRGYIYGKQMEFLSAIGSKTLNTCRLDDESEPVLEEDLDDPDDMEDPDSRSAESPPIDGAGPSTRPPDTDPVAKPPASIFGKQPPNESTLVIEDSFSHFMDCPEDTVPAVQPNTQDADDDKSFFESLLPLVKPLPIDTQLDFRMKVMNLLQEARASLTNEPSSTAGFQMQQHQMFHQPLASNVNTHLNPQQQQRSGSHQNTHAACPQPLETKPPTSNLSFQWEQSGPPQPTAPHFKKKGITTFQTQLLKMLDKPKPKEDDPDADRLFLLSLLPDVKSLHEDDKCDFKIGTLQMVRDLKRKRTVTEDA